MHLFDWFDIDDNTKELQTVSRTDFDHQTKDFQNAHTYYFRSFARWLELIELELYLVHRMF